MALAYKSNGEGDEDRRRANELEKVRTKILMIIIYNYRGFIITPLYINIYVYIVLFRDSTYDVGMVL